MFSTFKKLFGKRGGDKLDGAQVFAAPEPPRPAASPTPARVEARLRSQPAPARVAAIAGSTLALPLRAVLERLPADLAGRVRQMEVGAAEVFIPMPKVLTQLAQGAVKISFGELRQVSPPGTFSPENDRDRVLVNLPLQEILPRLNPALLARRPQKRIEVPPEVIGPFGAQMRATISTSPPLKPTTPSVPQALPPQPMPASAPEPVYAAQQGATDESVFKRANAPTSPTAAKPVPAGGAPVFNRVNAPPMPLKPVPIVPEPALKRPAPAPAPQREQPAQGPVFKRANPSPATPPVHTPIAPTPDSGAGSIPFSKPAAAPAPNASRSPEPEPIRFNPSFAPAPSTPSAPPIPQPSSSRETVFITLGLAELSAAWPQPVREEIAKLNLSKATASLPHGMIDGVIKTGKIAFPWKLVRSWIKPPVPSTYASPNDGVILELPLKVVTPAFLANVRSTRPQKKLAIDEEIPDLFFGAAGSEPAAAAPVAPARPAPVPAPQAAFAPTPTTSTDTNYFVRKDGADEPEEEEEQVVFKKGPTPGTSFLQRYATPNEIVNKAAALNGVGGSLIALPDGLLVASKVPADMNPDTMAAFLPQIFSRVSQCTRELRMGDLNNLNFTVGLIPWKIFRVGAIYFAAFGIAGQPLPTAQLAGIAAELDRKAK